MKKNCATWFFWIRYPVPVPVTVMMSIIRCFNSRKLIKTMHKSDMPHPHCSQPSSHPLLSIFIWVSSLESNLQDFCWSEKISSKANSYLKQYQFIFQQESYLGNEHIFLHILHISAVSQFSLTVPWIDFPLASIWSYLLYIHTYIANCFVFF